MKIRKYVSIDNVLLILIPAIIFFVIFGFEFIHLNTFIRSSYIGDSVAILLKSPGDNSEMFFELFIRALDRIFSGVLIYNVVSLLSVIASFIAFYFLLGFFNVDKHIKYLGSSVMLMIPIGLWYLGEWPFLLNSSFYILCLLFALKSIKHREMKCYILTGLFFGLNLYNHPYQGFILGVAISVLLLVNFFLSILSRKRVGLSKSIRLTIFISIFIIVFSLPTFALWKSSKNNTSDPIDVYSAKRNEHDRWALAARPWFYLIPDINHPILGDLAVKVHFKIWDTKPYYLTEPFFPKEHSLFAGYTLLFFSYYLFIQVLRQKYKPRRYVLLLFAVTISMFIFSLPPYIGFNDIKIYMPSHYMYDLLPVVRSYARFGYYFILLNSVLTFIGIDYFLKTRSETKRTGYFLAIALLLIFEFAFNPFAQKISTVPTPPYIWLTQQQEDFSYLELPKRLDYTDKLYENVTNHNKKPLNPYLATPANVEKIENSLWNINSDFATPYSLWCKDFKELGGKYILYHKKDLNKKLVAENFKKTGLVSPELKVALAESWGNPIWGNHVEKSNDDLLKEKRQRNMENLLTQSPIFRKVISFSNQEIIDSRPNKNFSADKFDEVTIFEINSEYCQKLEQQD